MRDYKKVGGLLRERVVRADTTRVKGDICG